MSSKFNFNFGNSPATPSGKGKGINFSQGPSTTPTVPPPSYLTNVSTTPAGEPPRSSKIFGSSYNPSQNTFGHRSNASDRKLKGGFRVPSSSPPAPGIEDADGEEDEYSDDEEMEEDVPAGFIASTIERDPQRGLKRSRNGEVRDSGMADIARSYVRNHGAVRNIEEKDDVVLKTEERLADLDETMHNPGQAVGRGEEVMANAAADLTGLWALHASDKTLPGGIGPEFDEDFTKASYVSSLLLQLHYPHTAKPTKSRSGQTMSSSVPPARALLDWLNQHHNPLPDDFNDVHLYRPSPAAHEAFWDIVGGDLIRGRFVRVVWLLRDARWENAATAAIDYEDEGASGYRGSQLDNTEEVVERCIRVLESCPAVTDDNWNLPGPEWSIFRQRVRHAIRELETFATALEDHAPAGSRTNIFGGGTTSMTAATARAESRVPPTIYQNLRALYGALLGGNGILDYAQDWLEASVLLTVWWDGDESTAALNASVADLAVSHNALRKSTRAGGATREVDVAPMAAYRRKLGDVFRVIPGEIDEPNFQPDSLDPVHVALATVLEDDVAEAIGIVRSWSQTLASAVVELAALGNWLPIPEGRPNSRGLLGRGFSTDDLMVLSHGPGGVTAQDGDGIDRDDVLSSYADLLASRERFTSETGKLDREGWELAISVLSRLNDHDAAQEKIRTVLEAMDIRDETRVEKVLAVCTGMGFEELGRGIAERYADSLASETPTPFGATLVYYARAHATPKLHSTLSHLISISLLHSTSMPPAQTLDPNLASLLSAQRTALVDLARVDASAAQLLGQHLSGYAMLRRFYDIRDLNANGSNLTRLRDAAKALVAVIESASDCIKGGLFDPDVESVVPVEGLLALLGETLPFFGRTSPTSGRPQRVLETKQILRLMAVVEDYEQINSRIREGGEGLLRASLGCFRGGSSGSRVLAKSTSGMSGSGLLSGSESWEQMVESSWSLLQDSKSSDGSGKGKRGKKSQILEIERGWDWRVGLDAVTDASGVESREVVMLLRTALAREMASAWTAGWE